MKAEERKYYSIEPIMEKVSKTEFDDFIKNYPRKLVVNVNAVFEPPVITYNDFELANLYPYSVVANTYVYDDDTNGYYYEPEDERIYKIMTNYEKVFNSKKEVDE